MRLPATIPCTFPASLTDLPREARAFCLSVRRFIQKELCVSLRGAHLVTAFSGGADSTALLLSLYYLAPLEGFTVSAAHLNHGLRPSAGEEQRWCRDVCAHLGVRFFAETADVAAARGNGGGLEEEGRNARYAFFRRVADSAALAFRAEGDMSVSRVYVALGHTGNDLAEDVLMRLMRGAGWPGLSGMRGIRGLPNEPDGSCAGCAAQGAIIRPLLGHDRSGVEGFVTGFGLPYVEDESNADECFLRNRVRRRLLPLFLEENPSFLESVHNLWLQGGYDEEWAAESLAAFDARLASSGSDIRFALGELQALPSALRLRLYKRAVDALGAGQVRFENVRRLEESVAVLLPLADAAKGGAVGHAALSSYPKQHQFPGGKVATVDKNGVTFALVRL